MRSGFEAEFAGEDITEDQDLQNSLLDALSNCDVSIDCADGRPGRSGDGCTLARGRRAVRYTFGTHELDDLGVELRRDGELIAVEPQVFDVLLYLVRHRDRVVTKEELLDAVWSTRFVGESALTTRVKEARASSATTAPARR